MKLEDSKLKCSKLHFIKLRICELRWLKLQPLFVKIILGSRRLYHVPALKNWTQNKRVLILIHFGTL